MRRLALKSSSAKKQLSESRKSILAVERQMTHGQIQEFQKLNRIFKTNLSSSKWQGGQEADPEDVEYDLEEQDIIDATSRHSKSISDHTTVTPGRKQQQSSYNNNPSMSQLPNVSAIYQDSLMMEESKVGRQRPSISAGRQSKTPKSSGKKQKSSKSSPYQQVHQFDITQNLVISKEAMNTIKRKMGDLARELAQNDEIGLDEATLVKFFESKTDKLLQTAAANKFTFDQISGRSKHSCWSRLSGADNNLSINESSRVLLSGGRMPPSRQAANYPHQSETFMNQKQQHNTSLSPSRVGLKPSARFRKGSESQRSRKSSKRENKGTTIRSRSSSKNMTQFSKEFKDTFAQRELINNLSQFSQSHDNRREVQEHKGSKKRHSRKASSNQNSRILKAYGCSSNRNKSGKSAVSRKSSNSALSHNYQRKSIDNRLASNSVISENRKSNNKKVKNSSTSKERNQKTNRSISQQRLSHQLPPQSIPTCSLMNNSRLAYPVSTPSKQILPQEYSNINKQ
ncbi:hypothetical protein FGO68_gene8077 [Halteria grandinella]|uniref:Uncharacterized protein n=1 Tax=Halteria grandinella TaxID=5974 RepID=A0A8J8NER2_HALGN|nr:hypothetical protein FGO68_gene8077 [Halteria grandinella]